MLTLIYNPRDLSMPTYYIEGSDNIAIVEDELSGRVCRKYLVSSTKPDTSSYYVVERAGNHVIETTLTREAVHKVPYFLEKALAYAVELVSGDDVQIVKR